MQANPIATANTLNMILCSWDNDQAYKASLRLLCEVFPEHEEYRKE